MADTRYANRYDRSEKNMMWTIAFVVLLLVLIVWGLWYFNRPVATGTDINAVGVDTTENTVTTGAGADVEGSASGTVESGSGVNEGPAGGVY